MFTKYALSVTLASLVLSSLSGAADQFPADNDFVRNAEQAANQEVAEARVAFKMSHHSDVRNAEKWRSDYRQILASLLEAKMSSPHPSAPCSA